MTRTTVRYNLRTAPATDDARVERRMVLYGETRRRAELYVDLEEAGRRPLGADGYPAVDPSPPLYLQRPPSDREVALRESPAARSASASGVFPCVHCGGRLELREGVRLPVHLGLYGRCLGKSPRRRRTSR